MDEGLTHLDEDGNARMVDVGNKGLTARTAVAEAVVTMAGEVKEQLLTGDLPKGDALGVARIAAIMAAKQTPHLVPLCHPVSIESIEVDVAEAPAGVRIVVTVRTTAKTGIEMEAMTAAAIGAVTIYDMVKGLDRAVEIGPVRLLHKSGGKTGEWNR